MFLFVVLILSLIIWYLLYFILSEKEKYIRATNREFRFSICITSMMLVFSFFGLSFIIGYLAIFLLRELGIEFEIFVVLFLLLIVTFFIIIRKLIFVVLDEKEELEKKETSNEINYKQVKFNSYFYLFVGLLLTIKMIFFPEDDLGNTIHIIFGIIVMVISLIMMIRSLNQPKVTINDYYLKSKTNWLTLTCGVLKWDEIDYIRIHQFIFGYKFVNVFHYEDDNIERPEKADKKIVISGLENIDDFIENIIKRADNVKVIKKVWIGGRILNHLKSLF